MCKPGRRKSVEEVKMHKVLVCVRKSQDFAQIQKNIARLYNRETATFRKCFFGAVRNLNFAHILENFVRFLFSVFLYNIFVLICSIISLSLVFLTYFNIFLNKGLPIKLDKVAILITDATCAHFTIRKNPLICNLHFFCIASTFEKDK